MALPEQKLRGAFGLRLTTPSTLNRMAVPVGRGRLAVLDPDTIRWIDAARNYVVLHCGDQAYRVRMAMDEIEAAMDPSKFARIHRSTTVNLAEVRELHFRHGGDFSVVLACGRRLNVGRTYRRRFGELVERVAPVVVSGGHKR